MVTRNQALFAKLSPALRSKVFQTINNDLGTSAYDTCEVFMSSAIASTLLDKSDAFRDAVLLTKLEAYKVASSYKAPNSRAYAEGYVKHVLEGNTYPPATNITLTTAATIRARIDKTIANVAMKNGKVGK